jgi:CRP-like cAMP-binding protein
VTKPPGNAFESLRAAISSFGESHPAAIRRFSIGQRVINQNAISDECFLIKQGTVSILVKDSSSDSEKQVALRFEGDLIGETAFLQRNAPRTASVQVITQNATLIRLTRHEIFGLLRENPALHDAVTLLWELAASRLDETQQILDGRITAESRVMSVLLADIHNFSTLGEATWEEQSNSFLFDFIEKSHDTAASYKGKFEDQGDGFKILFRDSSHADRSVACASEIADSFSRFRTIWSQRNDAFESIGLGIGICTDCMSIRKREGSLQAEGRILSHSINIAAAISKQRTVPSDIDIYIDNNTFSIINKNDYEIAGPQQKWLEKLGRLCSIYRIRGRTTGGDESREKVSILFLASEPTDAARLGLLAEASEIKKQLQLSKFRDRFTFHLLEAVKPEDLSQALLDVEPQIVHFSGHGTKAGELCFEDKGRKTRPISPGTLAALFREFSHTVNCVILNACYSDRQANAIAKHIDNVIGMHKEITNDAAIAFAVGMYQAIGAGKTVAEAFRLGRVQISLQIGDEDESLTPVLMPRSEGKA